MKEFIEKLIGRLEEVDRKTFRISPKDAIEIVNQLAEEYNQEYDDTDYVNIELYAFWQKHQWIPCSERLPELIDDMLQCVIVTDEKDWQGMAYYHPQKGWVFAECHNSDRKIDWTEIIAWQPLPQAYKLKE